MDDERMSERARHVEFIAEVGSALTKGITMREALQGCAEAMVRHLDAAFARVWVLNEKEETLELLASAGMYTHTDGFHSLIHLWKYPYKIAMIARERRPHLTNSVIGDPMIHDQEWAMREGMVAFAGHPLVVGNRLAGVAAMFARHALSESALKALSSVADEIAIGIEHFRMFEALKASEDRFRGLVEDSLAGAYIIQEGRIMYVNKALAAMYGYTKEELYSLRMGDLTYPEDWPAEEENNRKLLADEIASLNYQIRRRRKDGSTVYVEMFRWKTEYEGRPAIIGTAIDITERKDLERQKADFYAMVTHDFKSPLTAILGYTELLAGRAGSFDTETREMLDAVRSSSEKLLRMAEDFLLHSSLEAGMSVPNRQPVDVADLLKELEKEFAPRALEKGLTLTTAPVTDLPPVDLDKRQVERALWNLVQNSIKYTPPGGMVTVRATLSEEGPGRFIVIQVSDNGPGIPEEDQGRVFDKYFRSSRNTGTRGTGLGLAIVKAVAEAHDGKVEFHCPEGLGCTFNLFLPVTSPMRPKQRLPDSGDTVTNSCFS